MSRREDVFARVAQGQNRKRDPDVQAIRSAIQAITGLPEWQVVLDWLEVRERNNTALADADASHGALLRSAGRRSFLRELEMLDVRVIDDDRGEQPG